MVRLWMMTLSRTFDHRAIDGVPAARSNDRNRDLQPS
jgi:pyruvate/2-oxoglutarate dehydrogenase complex dihydrolipoamide acyltransferase (E2) component